MYPRNAASPPEIAIGAVVQISDGAVQSSAVSISVKAKGGVAGAGGGTTAYGTGGSVYYTPLQAETNYEEFIVEAYKTGCIPVAATVVTTASSTAGKVDVSHIGGTAQTARDIGANVLLSSGTGAGQVSLSSGAVLLQATQTGVTIPTVTTVTNQLSAAVIAAGVWDALVSGIITANSIGKRIFDYLDAAVSSRSTYAGGAVASVTGAVGSVTGLTAADVAAIKAKTDNLPASPASTQEVAAVAAYLDTEIAAILTIAQKLDTMLELDGVLYRLTVASLVGAPSGSGSFTAAEVAQIRYKLQIDGVQEIPTVNGTARYVASEATVGAVASSADAAATYAKATKYDKYLSLVYWTDLTVTNVVGTMVAGQQIKIIGVSPGVANAQLGIIDSSGAWVKNGGVWTGKITAGVLKIEASTNGENFGPISFTLTAISNTAPNGASVDITIPAVDAAIDHNPSCYYVYPDGTLADCAGGVTYPSKVRIALERRDALKLAPSAGAAAAGSIDEKLTNLDVNSVY